MLEKIVGHDLKKQYGGRQVVKGVTLDVEQGEVVGLLGANGAGKTTTFYMIVGLVKSDGGHVELNGKDITKKVFYERARLGVGYLPQEASIFREMSVEENIMCVAEVRKLSHIDKKNTMNRLIDEFNLGHVRNSLGRELSGGERRRVEIARALALDPKFILLDEPFAGVDPLAVSDIQGIIQGLKARGIGVLITDHSVRETLGIVDRAYVMNQGEVLVEGKPEEIVNNEVAKKMYLGEEFSM